MKFIFKHFSSLSVSEFYEIIRLRIKIFVVEQKCAYEECDEKDKDAYFLMVLSDDAQLVGTLRILKRGVSFPQVSIGRVAVDARYRGQRIARQMLEAAINFIADELKENEIALSAQSYLVKFYSSFGFEKISEEYLEDGIAHVDMLKI